MAALPQLARLGEDEARSAIKSIRWPNGPECPHCASMNAVRLEGKAARPGVLKCRDCGKQFAATVDTTVHRSKIPLSKWPMDFHPMRSGKKGIGPIRLQRELDPGNCRTAWHTEHRIRYALAAGGPAAALKGDRVRTIAAIAQYGGKRLICKPAIGHSRCRSGRTWTSSDPWRGS